MLLFLLIFLSVALLCYILSMMGRTGKKDLTLLKSRYYAHRGLHDGSIPENSMLAFRKAKDAGYGVELDVHLLKDGTLAVIHDSSLKRTVGQDRDIEDLERHELESCYLEGTGETVPLLEDVLALFDGAVPLVIELKPKGSNYAQLCSGVSEMLDRYAGAFCLESFDPRCIRWLRKHRPHWIRGQLAMNYFKDPKSKLPWILKLLLSNQMLNFLTRPDFVAYQFSDREHISNRICRSFWKITGFSWTLETHEEFDLATREGWVPIFEGFLP